MSHTHRWFEVRKISELLWKPNEHRGGVYYLSGLSKRYGVRVVCAECGETKDVWERDLDSERNDHQ